MVLKRRIIITFTLELLERLVDKEIEIVNPLVQMVVEGRTRR